MGPRKTRGTQTINQTTSKCNCYYYYCTAILLLLFCVGVVGCFRCKTYGKILARSGLQQNNRRECLPLLLPSKILSTQCCRLFPLGQRSSSKWNATLLLAPWRLSAYNVHEDVEPSCAPSPRKTRFRDALEIIENITYVLVE